MLELIFFYILQKNPGLRQNFLCARVTVFSGVRQQNFAGADLLCTGAAFDLGSSYAKLAHTLRYKKHTFEMYSCVSCRQCMKKDF